MILYTPKILKRLKEITDTVILFHSASGKDSIVLLDMLTKHGFKVTPVFMYMVKGITPFDNYIAWSERKYAVKFIQVPHFALSDYVRNGIMGIKKDPSQKIIKLTDIAKAVCHRTSIEWTVYGMKQNDSLVRHAMLRTYEMNAIYEKGKKCYPLSDWSNADCLKYIQKNRLIKPIATSNNRSQGFAINDSGDLQWLEKNYPQDLQKVFNQFPECEALLYQSRHAEKAY